MFKKPVIMIATSAFGYGIDVSVGWVFIYKMPNDVQDIVQMMGRAGRDTKRSCRAILGFPKDLHKNIRLRYDWLLNATKCIKVALHEKIFGNNYWFNSCLLATSEQAPCNYCKDALTLVDSLSNYLSIYIVILNIN